MTAAQDYKSSITQTPVVFPMSTYVPANCSVLDVQISFATSASPSHKERKQSRKTFVHDLAITFFVRLYPSTDALACTRKLPTISALIDRNRASAPFPFVRSQCFVRVEGDNKYRLASTESRSWQDVSENTARYKLHNPLFYHSWIKTLDCSEEYTTCNFVTGKCCL